MIKTTTNFELGKLLKIVPKLNNKLKKGDNG